MNAPRVLRSLAAALTLALIPVVALAQEPAPEPIDAPEGFAEVRERFEGMTAEEAEAAGYRAEPPVCISSPAGGMGIHYVNPELHEAQFASAEMDPENPPVILFSGDNSRVVGLEWEAADIGQGEPELFGQTVNVLAGHPGLEEPHYMLHAYFRPNGQVLFAEFDPELSCPTPPATSVIPDDPTAGTLSGAGVALLGAALVTALAFRPRRLDRQI